MRAAASALPPAGSCANTAGTWPAWRADRATRRASRWSSTSPVSTVWRKPSGPFRISSCWCTAPARSGRWGPLLESDPDEWRRAVEVNLIGTYNVLRAGFAGGLASNGGRAIHITTGAANSAKPYWSAYAVSKAGAEHLVRSAAADLGDNGCAVCALDPGITETAMQEEVRSARFPGPRAVRPCLRGRHQPQPRGGRGGRLRARPPRAGGSERTDVLGGGPVIGAATSDVGREAHELARRLFPLCRSLTGGGVRATFDLLEEHVPIRRTEIPSGTKVFDWTVPDEWNIRDAYIAAPDGTRVVDFRRSPLHVVSYSEPVRTRLPLDALRERLHTLPDRPELIPYRTSYYERTWGFCLSHRQLLELEPGDYEVVIDSTLRARHLTYAEHLVEGSRRGGGADLDLRLPPGARQRQPLGDRGRGDAREAAHRQAPRHSLPLPLRPRDDRPARLAAPEPRPARSGRRTA